MHPVLYSFRRCPYAMRARMALAYAGIQCELREVDLKNKPAKMLVVSPKGTVPVLQLQGGEVIDESLDIMRWALRSSDPDLWLQATSGTFDEMLTLISMNDNDFKHHLDRYKYSEHFDAADSTFHRQQGNDFLMRLDYQLNRHDYLFGNALSLADIAIFPFVRQFANTDRMWFDSYSWPALQAWLDSLINSALFLQVMQKHDVWQPGKIAVYLIEQGE